MAIILLFITPSYLIGQEIFLDYIENAPLNEQVDYKILSKYFKIDVSQWEKDDGIKQTIKNKIINKKLNVNTVVLSYTNGVGSIVHLYSFTNKGDLIDKKQIEEAFDNCDLSGPDYDYFYNISGNFVTISHRQRTPSQPTKEEPYRTHITKNFNTYIQICNHGYFFELTELNLQTSKRLFSYASKELVNIEKLKSLTRDELSIIRNEIFASHGYQFKSDRFKAYFNEQSWYNPRYSDVTEELSQVEKENILIIKSLEVK